MENLDEESFLYYKLSDIRMIYEGFGEVSCRKIYYKRRTAGCAQSDGGKVGDFEKQCVIALDGFTGFTPW